MIDRWRLETRIEGVVLLSGTAMSLEMLRTSLPGFPRMVPRAGGSLTPYINLDNAASTPALGPVVAKLMEFLSCYSSVHRGSGFLSQLATHAYEEAREVMADFLGASSRDSIIFVKNTTEAINKLSYRLCLRPGDVVIITEMEHHSNDLPWRSKARVVRAAVDSLGALDLDDLRRLIRLNASSLRLVAVTGASNVTGYVNDVHTIARLAHAHGAPILVDAAQLAPHRAIRMLPPEHPEHIDFLALSGHKMYAPFGGGVLVGPKRVFARGTPEYVGGGTVRTVTSDSVTWAEPPESEEAGSPNVVGAVTLAAAAAVLSKVGMTVVARHEEALLTRLLERLSTIDGVTLYGSSSAGPIRMGVVSFNVAGMNHASVAAALSHECGIGVRNGCFCARPYVQRLLNLSDAEIDRFSRVPPGVDSSALPGMVRVSLGLYNSMEEVDAVADQISRLAANPDGFESRYRRAGALAPPGGDLRRFFSLRIS